MNKKTLIASLGTTALLANLLLPGIAFGQLTQEGEVTVGCPAYVAGDLSFKRAPADVVFDGVVAGVDTDSVDSSVTSGVNLAGGNSAGTDIDGTSIVNDHLLRIQDRTSKGVDNCGAAPWAVTAAVTSAVTDPLVLSGKGLANISTGQSGELHSIDAADLYLVTSADVDLTGITTPEVPVLADWDNANPAQDRGTAPVYYARYNTSNVGNPDDLNSSWNILTDAFEVPANYSTNGTSLEATVPILAANVCGGGWKGGHDADIYMGIGLALDNAIDTLQAAGTYTGTITYTFGPLTC